MGVFKTYDWNKMSGDNKTDKVGKISKRIRPWQRLGFKNKKAYLLWKKEYRKSLKNGDIKNEATN